MKKDEAIKADIQTKLDSDPSIISKNIIVNVHNNIVTFSGSVKNYYEKFLVEKLAKNVQGVVGIVEELQVSLVDNLVRSDPEIAEAAINAIKWDSALPPNSIQVIVEKGTVILTGEVDSHFQRQKAEEDIRYLYGVRNVINNLLIRPSSNITPEQVFRKILSEFQRNASLDARKISIEVTDSTIILKGNVRSWAEYDEACHAAWSVLGVTAVDASQLNVNYGV